MSKYSQHLKSSERKGHNISQLTNDQLAELDGFVEWLKGYRTKHGTIMSDGSRGSYRSYMAEVMVITERGGDITESKYASSLASAIRLFDTYLADTGQDEGSNEDAYNTSTETEDELED